MKNPIKILVRLGVILAATCGLAACGHDGSPTAANRGTPTPPQSGQLGLSTPKTDAPTTTVPASSPTTTTPTTNSEPGQPAAVGTSGQTATSGAQAAVQQDGSAIQSYTADQQQLQIAINQAKAQGQPGQTTVSEKEFQLNIISSL